jgi:hypothetical protein
MSKIRFIDWGINIIANFETTKRRNTTFLEFQHRVAIKERDEVKKEKRIKLGILNLHFTKREVYK